MAGKSTTGRDLKELARRGLKIGRGLSVQPKDMTITFEVPARINRGQIEIFRDLRIGAFSYLRSGVLRNLASIGRYCSIGPNFIAGEAEHPTTWLSTSPAQYSLEQFAFFEERDVVSKRLVKRRNDVKKSPCRIGHDVWIGANVILRNGVEVSDGAVIGANSLVLTDVPPYTIVAGSPARFIRKRFSDEVISDLLSLRWWEFNINDLAGVDFSDIVVATAEIRARETSGLITRCMFDERKVHLSRNLVWTIEGDEPPATTGEADASDEDDEPTPASEPPNEPPRQIL